MCVVKVTEISATSSKSFEDALEQGIVRATKTLGNVRSASVMKRHVHVSNGSIVGYQIRMMVTFVVIEDPRRRVRVQEERLDEDRANSMTDEGGPPKPAAKLNQLIRNTPNRHSLIDEPSFR
jgi:flavin-binding protein dodecin